MEMQIAKSKLNMCDKIPEIEKALEIIEFLDKKKGKFFKYFLKIFLKKNKRKRFFN